MSWLGSYSGTIVKEVIGGLHTYFLLMLSIRLSDELLVLSQEHLVHGSLSLQLVLKVLSLKNSSKSDPQKLVFGLGVFNNFLGKRKESESRGKRQT
jgi:hypothetical protein